MPSTLFNFTKLKQHYKYTVDSQLILHIKNVSDSLAYLYFTDENNNNIDIPNNIILYSVNENDDKIVSRSYVSSKIPEVNRPPFDGMFYYMDCTDYFEITYNDIIILTLNPTDSWEIVSN